MVENRIIIRGYLAVWTYAAAGSLWERHQGRIFLRSGGQCQAVSLLFLARASNQHFLLSYYLNFLAYILYCLLIIILWCPALILMGWRWNYNAFTWNYDTFLLIYFLTCLLSCLFYFLAYLFTYFGVSHINIDVVEGNFVKFEGSRIVLLRVMSKIIQKTWRKTRSFVPHSERDKIMSSNLH